MTAGYWSSRTYADLQADVTILLLALSTDHDTGLVSPGSHHSGWTLWSLTRQARGHSKKKRRPSHAAS